MLRVRRTQFFTVYPQNLESAFQIIYYISPPVRRQTRASPRRRRPRTASRTRGRRRRTPGSGRSSAGSPAERPLQSRTSCRWRGARCRLRWWRWGRLRELHTKCLQGDHGAINLLRTLRENQHKECYVCNWRFGSPHKCTSTYEPSAVPLSRQRASQQAEARRSISNSSLHHYLSLNGIDIRVCDCLPKSQLLEAAAASFLHLEIAAG